MNGCVWTGSAFGLKKKDRTLCIHIYIQTHLHRAARAEDWEIRTVLESVGVSEVRLNLESAGASELRLFLEITGVAGIRMILECAGVSEIQMILDSVGSSG